MVDFTGVSEFEVSSHAIRQVAADPPAFPDGYMRVLVIPKGCIYGLARMFQILAKRLALTCRGFARWMRAAVCFRWSRQSFALWTCKRIALAALSQQVLLPCSLARRAHVLADQSLRIGGLAPGAALDRGNVRVTETQVQPTLPIQIERALCSSSINFSTSTVGKSRASAINGDQSWRRRSRIVAHACSLSNFADSAIA